MARLLQLLKKPSFSLALYLSLILNGLLWFLIIWRITPTNTWIPLHYHAYFGIDWIGPWRDIIYYPLLSLAIIALNTIMAIFTSQKIWNLTLILMWSSLVVQLIIFISLFNLIINYFT